MALPRKSFKTEKGTELPLLNLKGKEYLQVMHRLVWFKEKYPGDKGSIKTTLVATGGEGKDEYYIFRAEIYIDTERGPTLVATGHKKETVGNFADAMEKAESGAVGRALAMLGVGTAFAADDLDEGTRLADAPAPVENLSEKVVTVASTTGDGNVGTSTSTTRRPSFRKNVTVGNTLAAQSASDDI